ncbi:anti-sigma factor RsbA family regulatory protein [Cryptosporangium sp. NPDC048952]|uniref:anti-sigma factor RsbA family regulatory protein n=1 Tax=Cryptosporangium sp. NPDC048952 TaxID=3363961 RepID=UPI00371AC0C1
MTAAQIEGDPSPDAGPTLGHQALIYSSRDEFTASGVEFLRQGLDQGDTVVLATPNAADLVEALGSHADRVEVVDDRAWHHVPAWTIGGYARRTERASRKGHRLRVLTEIRWDAQNTTEWECYESLLNPALDGLSIDLCCAYDADGLAPEVVDTARRTHPSTRGLAGVAPSETYVPAVEFLSSGPQPTRFPVPVDALRVEFGAAEIPSVRQTALGWARDAGMNEDDASEFLIAIYEIASNAVEHGGGRGVGRFWSEADRLYCDIWSARQIGDPLVAGYRPPGTAQERGRGLWLARQICEHVTIYNNGGATVQLVRSVASN